MFPADNPGRGVSSRQAVQSAPHIDRCGRQPNLTRALDQSRHRNNSATQLAGTETGKSRASANLYSLIETCNANSIDPYTYLVDLFRKLPSAKTAEDFEALLPWRLGEPVF